MTNQFKELTAEKETLIKEHALALQAKEDSVEALLKEEREKATETQDKVKLIISLSSSHQY